SETSLIQTIGRSARNVNAEVFLYADMMTDSMQRAIDETNRRREVQHPYNAEHGITPETIKKAIRRGIEDEIQARQIERSASGVETEGEYVTQEHMAELEAEMLAAAEALEFERAANLRDKLLAIKASGGKVTADSSRRRRDGDEADGQRSRGRKGKGSRSRGRVPRPKRG
ncbi:MAG: UvrB/UvrC motif-containing protein, partial [Planctomycetaceae bacterium]|nr:UvrB/UvrC motif-containing protein [Planctomycetaceae bacterium]